MPSPRTIAREYAFQFLYHLQLAQFNNLKEIPQEDEDFNKALEDTITLFEDNYGDHISTNIDQNNTIFAKRLISGVIKSDAKLKEDIGEALNNRTINKINKIDLTILLLASYELLYAKENPPKVILNEAINLAKRFGTEKSFSFVNGVLNKLSKR